VLNDLLARAKKLMVDEELLTESVTIDADTYKVYLGDQIRYYKNGDTTGEYDFRRGYSAREKGWQTLLGGLETKITLAETLNPKLIKALVEPYIKEAVLDRLIGEGDMPDNEQILRTAADKRLKKLVELVPEALGSIRVSFTIPSPSENYSLTVNWNYGGKAQVKYGDGFKGIRTCWSFLANYEQIEKTVKKFGELIAPVFKFCENANTEEEE
jgi:hypothetical protein